jgi:hypothetical protein
MSWVKIDDKFTEHPKSISVGPLGIAMQVAALCYANTHLTDGFIPYNVVRKLLTFEFSPPGSDLIYTIGIASGMSGEDVTWEMVSDWLLDAGIWEKADGGFYIHDYPEYQPLKSAVLKEREGALNRMKKLRSGGVQAKFSRSSGEVLPKFNGPDPDPDPIKKEESVGTLIPLSQAFVEVTNIPEYTGGPARWNDGLKAMLKAGCTPDDLKKAVFDLRNAKGKEYTITSPSSIVTAAINVMSKRTSNNNGHNPAVDFKGYTEG